MIHYILQLPPKYQSAASYNRVRLFKKGFEKMSFKVSIHKIFIKNGNTLQKIFSLLLGYTKIFAIFLLLKKDDIVIVYGETYFTSTYCFLSRRAHLIIERTEYPAFIINNNISTTASKNSHKNIDALKHAALMITCSSFLRDFYSKYVEKVIVAPLIVDLSEYSPSQISINQKPDKYIAYCGYFGNNKDGVPILIEAFAKVVERYNELNLVLIGSGPKTEVDKFKELVNSLGIKDKVIFTGSLPHDVVIDWLCNASILALARPNNKQAEGGIPSKVGEYLASGVPCVITKVGDLPTYLKDGYDCFISTPDSVSDFASKIIECLRSDKTKIGNNAKYSVMQFNYDIQANCLLKKIQDSLGL